VDPVKLKFVPQKDGAYKVFDDSPGLSATFYGWVERRQTTKTGFKRGRCVGQVPCKRWFAHRDTPGGARNPYDEKFIASERFHDLSGDRTREEAARRLVASAKAGKP
jgi:hypothetical protein